MPEKWPHTGAVLAGGAGRRMGRRKDSLALPDGRTMLAVVHSVLREVCQRVVVVGDAETDLPRIEDLRPGQGPLGGIEALLATGDDTQYLVGPCDLPLITPSVLRRLTEPGPGAPVCHVARRPVSWRMRVLGAWQRRVAVRWRRAGGSRPVGRSAPPGPWSGRTSWTPGAVYPT